MGLAGRRLVAIVFDLDGTLIDSKVVVPDAYIAAVQRAGGPTYSREQVIQAYPLGPPPAILTHLLGRPCRTAETEVYHDCLTQTAHTVGVYPGVRETLFALERLVPAAVFTGATLRACSILLEGTGLRSHFSALVGADEVARPKPSPDGILLACERLRVPATSVAYVGDSHLDMEAARRCGVLAVAAGWGHLYDANTFADRVLNWPQELVTLLLGRTE